MALSKLIIRDTLLYFLIFTYTYSCIVDIYLPIIFTLRLLVSYMIPIEIRSKIITRYLCIFFYIFFLNYELLYYMFKYSPVISPKMKNVENRFMSENRRASCRNKHRYVCRTKSATTKLQKSISVRFARQTINGRNVVSDDLYFQWRSTKLVTNNSIGQMDTVSPNYGAKRLRSEKIKLQLPTDRQRLVRRFSDEQTPE